jgi:formyl-CoA transferase
MSEQVLGGIRVIDMATYIFGPASTTVMSDYGADVIKVESPGIGDPYRHAHRVPPFEANEVDYQFQLDNRNKRGLVLDMLVDEGREALLDLVRTADVFVTNFPPRVLEKLRIRYEELAPHNERLIYAQVTGYGEQGGEIDKPGFDATAYWARTGLMDSIRTPDAEPALPAPGMGDHPSAMSLFGGIMLALFKRERTGKGTKVSSSLLANGAWSNSVAISSILAGCPPIQAVRREDPPNALINQYRTRDDRYFLLVSLSAERDWPRLAQAIGRPELANDARFADKGALAANASAAAQALQEAFAQRDFAEWAKLLDDAKITFGFMIFFPKRFLATVTVSFE